MIRKDSPVASDAEWSLLCLPIEIPLKRHCTHSAGASQIRLLLLRQSSEITPSIGGCQSVTRGEIRCSQPYTTHRCSPVKIIIGISWRHTATISLPDLRDCSKKKDFDDL